LKKITKVFPKSLKNQIRDTFLFKKEESKFPEEERETLENFYREDVKQLQILLGRKMPWDWIK